MGKHFQPLPSASPGPIYEQPSMGIDPTNGVSFTKAARPWAVQYTPSPGPGAYMVPSSIGHQQQSQWANPPSAVFSSKAFDRPGSATPSAGGAGSGGTSPSGVSRRSRATPTPSAAPPGSYLKDILHLPVARGTGGAPAFSLAGRHSPNVWISRKHFADTAGKASPGPAYDVSGMQRGTFRGVTAIAFGDHGANPAPRGLARTNNTTEDECDGDDGRLSQTQGRPIPKSDTPGPAAYDINDKLTHPTVGGAISFTRSGRVHRFFSRALSSVTGQASPGAVYDPKYTAIDAAAPAAFLGLAPEAPTRTDRFTYRTYQGKELTAYGLGVDSPGPIYGPGPLQTGPAHSMSFKEGSKAHRTKDGKSLPAQQPSGNLFPKPTHARYIGGESDRENLGTWSPGPVYDTRGDISSQGVAHAFGPGYQSAAERTQSPTAARSIKSAAAGDTSGATVDAPPAPRALQPNDSYLSTTRQVRTVRINPPPDPVRRAAATPQPHSGSEGGSASPVRASSPDLRRAEPYPTATTVSFTRAPRMPKLGGFGSAPQYGLTSPGPHYNINWHLIEGDAHAVRFGQLS
jgi:hypothetical protein